MIGAPQLPQTTRSCLVLLLWVHLAGLAPSLATADGGVSTLPIELTKSNFTEYLQEQPGERWVLMEYYAHWCGHCRHFQPEYERISAFFVNRGELQPKVLVARLDCANEAELCGKFKVEYYPTLRLGLAADFASQALDSLTSVEGRTLKEVVAFVEKHLDVKLQQEEFEAAAAVSSSSSNEEVVQPHPHMAMTRNDPPQADLNDVEGATVKAWEYMLATPLLLEGVESRQALWDWLDLLAGYHPVKRCKKGAKVLHDQFESLWPAEAERPNNTLETKKICPGSRFKDWTSCRGSVPGSRGYSCGLWLLLHSLAARMPEEGTSGAVWMTAVRGFIKHFFQCSECSKHFVSYASTEEAMRVQTKREAMLWAWVAHNKVNGRLAAKEREEPETADKEWPHLIWPTMQQCEACRKSDMLSGKSGDIPDWDNEQVYQFLLRYYAGGGSKAGQQEYGLRGLLAKRTKNASWVEAGLVCSAVGAVVYLVLKGSSQYRLRKSESRLL